MNPIESTPESVGPMPLEYPVGGALAANHQLREAARQAAPVCNAIQHRGDKAKIGDHETKGSRRNESPRLHPPRGAKSIRKSPRLTPASRGAPAQLLSDALKQMHDTLMLPVGDHRR